MFRPDSVAYREYYDGVLAKSETTDAANERVVREQMTALATGGRLPDDLRPLISSYLPRGPAFLSVQQRQRVVAEQARAWYQRRVVPWIENAMQVLEKKLAEAAMKNGSLRYTFALVGGPEPPPFLPFCDACPGGMEELHGEKGYCEELERQGLLDADLGDQTIHGSEKGVAFLIPILAELGYKVDCSDVEFDDDGREDYTVYYIFPKKG